jgi:hypothetical protein
MKIRLLFLAQPVISGSASRPADKIIILSFLRRWIVGIPKRTQFVLAAGQPDLVVIGDTSIVGGRQN